MRPTAGRQLGVNWATSGWRLDRQRCHTIGPRSARRGCRDRTPSSSRQRPVRLRNSTTRARLETTVPLMTGRAAATKSEPGRHEPASKEVRGQGLSNCPATAPSADQTVVEGAGARRITAVEPRYNGIPMGAVGTRWQRSARQEVSWDTR